MSWYRTGTISVTNGSPTVSGVGTAWIDAIHAGWGIGMPNGTLYEIASVNSATSLTLAKPYEGASQTAQSYSVMPTQGAISQLYTQVKALIEMVQSTIDGAGKGKFLDGTAAVPGVRFAADEDSGLARLGTNLVALVTSGIARLKLSSTDLQVNVPITGSAVQSSPTDTTPGRVLMTGAFGLGENAGPYVGDLDAFSKAGLYHAMAGGHASASLGDNPWPTYNGAFGLVVGGSKLGLATEYVWQQAFRFGATHEVAIRQKSTTATGWSSWSRVYHQSDVLGAVSQVAGVPTGGLIERGSNANGDYVRFADGTQICTFVTSATYVNTTRLGSSWTYPVAFSGGSTPVLTVTLRERDTSNATAGLAISKDLAAASNSIIASSASVVVFGGGFVSGNLVWISVTAIGRWY